MNHSALASGAQSLSALRMVAGLAARFDGDNFAAANPGQKVAAIVGDEDDGR